jgi:hypothetical protein
VPELVEGQERGVSTRMRAPPGPPMSLGNRRQNGVRAVTTTCEECNHSADVSVDAMPETVYVPHVGRRLRCSACGGKQINTRPAWHTAPSRGFRPRP